MKTRVIVLLIVAGCGTLVAASAQEAPARPNIVLCMADDQGFGDMAYNGHPQLKTPVFDEMARTGLRFDRFYAAAPVCSPTRASVLTGRTPNRSGVFSWGHSLRPQEVTIAEVLRESGYATGHFGKWHLGSVLPDADTSPGAQGFDEWLSAPNFFEVNPWLSRRGRAEKMTGEGSAVIVAEAVRFMTEHAARQQPFLTVIWFGSPHLPHIGTPADLALYADLPPKQQHFLAEITAMDRAMGQLRTALRDLQLADNTLLWYCSDNGALPVGSTGGLRGRKGAIYEGGLRVPALIEWPAKVTAPRIVEAAVSTVDIYPTLIDITGAKPPHQPVLDGESLLSIIENRQWERSQPLGFWESGFAGFPTPSEKILEDVAAQQQANAAVTNAAALGLPPAKLEWQAEPGQFQGHAAWIDQGWKLHRIENKQTHEVRWELYNLADDPQEQHDVWAAEAKKFAELRPALEAWLASVTRSLDGADYQEGIGR